MRIYIKLYIHRYLLDGNLYYCNCIYNLRPLRFNTSKLGGPKLETTVFLFIRLPRSKFTYELFPSQGGVFAPVCTYEVVYTDTYTNVPTLYALMMAEEEGPIE